MATDEWTKLEKLINEIIHEHAVNVAKFYGNDNAEKIVELCNETWIVVAKIIDTATKFNKKAAHLRQMEKHLDKYTVPNTFWEDRKPRKMDGA